MIKICEICNDRFDTNSSTRIYCYKCSGDSTSWQDYKNEALKCILVCSNCHKEIHCELGYKK